MSRINHIYDECEWCEYIEDCPHPDVNERGHAIPPEECLREYLIKLYQRDVQVRKDK